MKTIEEKSKRKLKERNFKLNTLLEVSNTINNLDDDLDLFDHFKNVLTDKLSLGKGVLVSKTEVWSVQIRFGDLVDFRDRDLIQLCFDYDKITVLNDTYNPILSIFDVLIPIYHNSVPISYLLLGDFEGEKIEVSPIIRHLPFIQTLTNLIVVAQENKRLYGENLKQAALKKELELARQMQSLLIPYKSPERKDFDVYAVYQPHQEVGGDYYDFFPVSEDESVFCMADISGKGISAALLMSNFQAMMHAILEYDRNLDKLLRSLNNRLFKNTNGEKFITAFIGLFNHKTEELSFVNAGHQPALLCLDNKVIELTDGSTVLGAMEELPHLNIGKVHVPQGSTLIAFTDGVCEVENEASQEFGTDIMKGVLLKHREKRVKTIIGEIVQSISNFKGKMSFSDDLALMGIRFGK